jgi:hypothetical protein
VFIGNINVPDEVVTDPPGGLVVFVGAGASVDAPSSLPLFVQLAEQIARGFSKPISDLVKRELKDEPDRYLGKLEAEELPVRDALRRIIGASTSEPNHLHKSLVGLFGHPSQLRIVTTNYDTHLESVANARYGSSVRVFEGPALPMGNDFTGIVHLHGSMVQEDRHLVVTDSDFGRAYLKDAWAARFLSEMYRTFTVLFVGYSHADWMMRYLARGLPHDGRRYALVPDNDTTDWEILGVNPIRYSVSEGDHVALGDLLSEWARQVGWGLLEREADVRTIASSAPQIDPAQADRLRRYVQDPVLAPVFYNHSLGIEWLNWWTDEPLFKQLFIRRSEDSVGSRLLARWFSLHFVLKDPDVGLDIVARFNGRLSDSLWQAIALATRHTDMPSDVRARWVAVLLSAADGRPGASEELGWLAHTCKWESDRAVVLALLDYLWEPQLEMGPAFLGSSRAEATLQGEEFVLGEIWQNMTSHLADCAIELAPIVLRHLSSAHRLLVLTGDIHDGWDPMSYSRAAIEPHEQNSIVRSIDHLINAGRDVLDALTKLRPDLASGYLATAAESESVLLRRLAIHVWAVRTDVGADERLAWVLRNCDLFDFRTKHEVYRLIRAGLPESSNELKESLMAFAREHLSQHPGPAPEVYEVYNLMVWMADSDPGFGGAAALRDQLSAAHGYQPREHPDLARWLGEVTIGLRRTIALPDLLKKAPAKALEWLAKEKRANPPDGSPFGGYRDAIETFREAVTEKPTWGLGIAKRLIRITTWDSDAWEPTLRGWTMASLEPEQLRQILVALRKHTHPVLLRGEIATLLEKAPTSPETPLPLFDEVQGWCRRLWALGPDSDVSLPELGGDWLMAAINDWAGKVTLAWLRALSGRRARAGDKWAGLSQEDENFLNRLIAQGEAPSRLATAVVGSQVHFLNSVAQGWTNDRLLPLFDWDTAPEVAPVVWDGFLSWGQPDQNIVTRLLGQYLNTAKRFGPGQKRNRVCEHLAAIALFNPLAVPQPGGWLDTFVAESEAEVRTNWASHIGRYLRQGDSGMADGAWDRWIGQYWRRRLQGQPRPIDAVEGSEMLSWVTRFGERRRDAVDLMIATPVNHLRGQSIRDIFDADSIQSTPKALGQLLRHVLPSLDQDSFYSHAELRSAVELLSASGKVAVADLRTIREHALRLGCSDAGDWVP